MAAWMPANSRARPHGGKRRGTDAEDPLKSADATPASGCREIWGSNNSHHLWRPYYVRNSLNTSYFYLVSSWQQVWRWYVSQGSLYYERQSRSSSNGDGRKYVGLLRALEENPRN